MPNSQQEGHWHGVVRKAVSGENRHAVEAAMPGGTYTLTMARGLRRYDIPLQVLHVVAVVCT